MAKCQNHFCDAQGTEDLHSCPFDEEIHDCHEVKCNCCNNCLRRCAEDV